MQIDKNMIINMLRERGQNTEADQAQAEMPNQVDPEQHGDMLSRFGLNPQELMSMFSGGGNAGGGMMGGMMDQVKKRF